MTASRVVLPTPDPPAPPARLPLLALIAPAGAATVIWAVTGQALALVFAALGPVSVLASIADQWWGARRATRLARRRFDERLAAAREQVAHEHDREREERRRARPDGPAITALQRDSALWRTTSTLVTVGMGVVPSRLEATAPTDAPADVAAVLDEVAERARRLDGPVEVDPADGIALAGSPILARAVWRGLVVQCAHRWGPEAAWIEHAGLEHAGIARVGIERVGASESWIDLLPHTRRVGAALSPTSAVVRFRAHADGAVLAVLSAEQSAPPTGVVHVLSVGDGEAVLESAGRTTSVRPAPLSRAAAAEWAGRLDAGQARAVLPEVAPLAPLLAETRGLSCAVAVDARGPFVLDLLEHGPHAVVAGTTGSGKSELLVSWVVALAAGNAPSALCFLLVDFKGGAAFAPLAVLPHVVGIVTDLDAEQADRALRSLRAELRRRERALADPGARVGAGEVPRLVIVVDEFAAMVDAHPELHALMTDLAARGRSLGMHLVLCTQRPAGVVRDGLLANADLRVSLRVNNAADSRAVLDAPDAASIEARHRGRAIVRRAGEPVAHVQVARTDPSDIEAVRDRWAGHPTPPRPWRERLPSAVTAADLDPAGEGIRFGLVDLPAEQRWATAVWNPRAEGHLLVVGAPRSGRTTALAAVGARTIAAEPDLAWDDLSTLVARLTARERVDSVVGIDDLDALLPRFDPDHRGAVVDAIGRLLREGPALGLHVALATRRLGSELHGLGSLLPSVLRLRHASRHDWLLSGGEGDPLLAGPPGAARWQGERAQVVRADPAPTAHRSPVAHPLDPRRPLAVVIGAPAARSLLTAWSVVGLDAVPSAGLGAGQAAVGDVDEWQARFGLLPRLRADADLVFLGCSPAEVRAVTRSRTLPPPFAVGADPAWRLRADGAFERIRLPLG